MKKKSLIISGTGDIASSINLHLSASTETIVTTKESLDLSSNESVEYFLDKFEHTVDNIIFCATINNLKKFSSISLQDIEHAFKINFLSFIKIIHKLSENNKIRENGSVVIISSIYSKFSRKNRFPYSVSKHALSGISKSLALELSNNKIRVNTVSPGFIDTKMTRNNLKKDQIDKLKTQIPLGRLGTTNDVAKLVTFLCSEDSSYITGQDFIVDGGYIAGGFFDN